MFPEDSPNCDPVLMRTVQFHPFSKEDCITMCGFTPEFVATANISKRHYLHKTYTLNSVEQKVCDGIADSSFPHICSIYARSLSLIFFAHSLISLIFSLAVIKNTFDPFCIHENVRQPRFLIASYLFLIFSRISWLSSPIYKDV